ncbi:MAG: hypothetical protein V1928_04025 [Parcubacteria group bacterium]
MLRQIMMRRIMMQMVVKYYLMQYVLTQMNGGNGGLAITPDEEKAIELAFWL